MVVPITTTHDLTLLLIRYVYMFWLGSEADASSQHPVLEIQTQEDYSEDRMTRGEDTCRADTPKQRLAVYAQLVADIQKLTATILIRGKGNAG